MLDSIVASQAKGKKLIDSIFATNALAQEASKIYGNENVVNGTIGAILDESEVPLFMKNVEQVYRNLPAKEYSQYAPIAGIPEYLVRVEEQCFGAYRPDAFIKSIAIAGGTGGLHHMVHNYTALGDEVLTSDWFWGPYNGLCTDNGRKLATFTLYDDNLHFNHASFQEEVLRISSKQVNTMIWLNTPAHNPTGFTLSEQDWDSILAFLKSVAIPGEKNIILGVDVAYLDYAGEKDQIRSFFTKFSGLPDSIFVNIVYSLSKGYTLYGQRMGALIAISSNQSLVDEFWDVHCSTSRSTWSNLSRPAMQTLVEISKSPERQKAFEEERASYYRLIKERANIFMEEAATVGLPVLPYHAGFFISIPSPNPKAVCEELQKENVFLVPLKMGIRVAACGVTKKKMKGLAEKVAQAMKKVGQL